MIASLPDRAIALGRPGSDSTYFEPGSEARLKGHPHEDKHPRQALLQTRKWDAVRICVRYRYPTSQWHAMPRGCFRFVDHPSILSLTHRSSLLFFQDDARLPKVDEKEACCKRGYCYQQDSPAFSSGWSSYQPRRHHLSREFGISPTGYKYILISRSSFPITPFASHVSCGHGQLHVSRTFPRLASHSRHPPHPPNPQLTLAGSCIFFLPSS